jgi:hypothetical protein
MAPYRNIKGDSVRRFVWMGTQQSFKMKSSLSNAQTLTYIEAMVGHFLLKLKNT